MCINCRRVVTIICQGYLDCFLWNYVINGIVYEYSPACIIGIGHNASEIRISVNYILSPSLQYHTSYVQTFAFITNVKTIKIILTCLPLQYH